MFVGVNAIFNTWSVILYEGRIGGYHPYACNDSRLQGSEVASNGFYLIT